jgi:hypothetical protein
VVVFDADADAGAFAALGGQHVGVSGVGVAPAQVGVQVAGQDDVVGVVGVGHRDIRSGPNWASIGSAQEALVGVRHNSTLCAAAHVLIAGVVLQDRLSSTM